MEEPLRRVILRIKESIYLELIRRYGIRRLSIGVNELLEIALKTSKSEVQHKSVKKSRVYPLTIKQENYIKHLINRIAKLERVDPKTLYEKYNIDFNKMSRDEGSELIELLEGVLKDLESKSSSSNS